MLRRLALGAAIILLAGVAGAPGARAAHDQAAMIQDLRVTMDGPGTVAQFVKLGAQQVRLLMVWSKVAPAASSFHRPANFHASDPAAYPDAAWAPWDGAVRASAAGGLSIDLDISAPVPLWATGRGMPTDQPHPSWEPQPSEYAAFLHAVGERYSGDYDPLTHRLDPGNPDDLPRVSFWSIWNEPNYGPSLAPQGTGHHLTTEHSPMLYRALVDAAWATLAQTGHGHDTILFGELAPRGWHTFGWFSGMKPLLFLRTLYCVDSRYRPLLGSAAAVRGCPTTAAGRRGFRAAHPGLFDATGFAIHPYSRWFPPNLEAPNDPDYASLADMDQLTGSLDRLQRVYGSHRRFPIWDTEYGYLTDPPKHTSKRIPYISPVRAAGYLNQAEYISWRNPRIRSYMQYLLYDEPVPPSAANDWGGFASGLIAWNGVPKPTYDAFRMPLYLPVTRSRKGHALEVWGCVRPVSVALRDDPGAPQSVQVRFRPAGQRAFSTVATIPVTDPHGYFDARVAFPGSGTLHLAWAYPTDDPALPNGTTINSRGVAITLR